MRRILTSPIALLFIILIGFGIAYFGLNYFADSQSKHTSPDGNYTVEVYQYPFIGAFFGSINDGPGFLIFTNANTNEQQRKPVGLISVSDSISWSVDTVHLGATIALPISDAYPLQKGFEKSYSENFLNPAIKNGNVVEANRAIAKGAILEGHNHLTIAVSNNDSAMIALLLAHPGYLDFVNSLQSNVMNDTLLVGNTTMIQFLIENGVNTNFKDRQGESPFIAAVRGNHTETIVMLLENKINAQCYTGESRKTFETTERKFQRKIQRMLKSKKLRCWALEKAK